MIHLGVRAGAHCDPELWAEILRLCVRGAPAFLLRVLLVTLCIGKVRVEAGDLDALEFFAGKAMLTAGFASLGFRTAVFEYTNDEALFSMKMDLVKHDDMP